MTQITLNDAKNEFLDLVLTQNQIEEYHFEKTENDVAIEKAKQATDLAKAQIEEDFAVKDKKERNKVLMGDLVKGYRTVKMKVIAYPDEILGTVEFIAAEEKFGFTEGEVVTQRPMTIEEKFTYGIYKK